MPYEPSFRRSRVRDLLLVMVAWAMVAAGAEIVAQAAFRLLPASSPIRRLVYPSRFRLQRMARVVDDDRIATLIPHYRAVLTDDDYPANRPWRVTIDGNGFRGDRKHYEGKPAVVAFIGDSVPFGWGVDDDRSVPWQLQELFQAKGLTTHGVLNAAVPSYSLQQAVERYKREIAGRYPVVAVVVQTLDPPITFSLLGERWTPSTSFHTRQRQPSKPLFGSLEVHLEKSLVLSVALRLAYRTIDRAGTLPAPRFTAEAWRNFDASNLAALAELRDIARADNTQVILLPVNPGPEPHRVYTTREREAIERYNQLLEGFAARYVEVTFFDVTGYFERHPRRAALFVDSCCHLSEDGAWAQAIYLYDAMTRAHIIGAPEL
jgi:hypothetical protein